MRFDRALPCCLAVVVLAVALGCGPTAEPTAVSLVEAFPEATVDDAFTPSAPAEPVEWRFDGEGSVDLADDGAPATFGWTSLSDIEGLRVVDGLLVGTTGELPLIVTDVPPLDRNDTLHSIEIRMRVSEGTQFGVGVVAEGRSGRGGRRCRAQSAAEPQHRPGGRRRRNSDLHPDGRRRSLRTVLFARQDPASDHPAQRRRRRGLRDRVGATDLPPGEPGVEGFRRRLGGARRHLSRDQRGQLTRAHRLRRFGAGEPLPRSRHRYGRRSAAHLRCGSGRRDRPSTHRDAAPQVAGDDRGVGRLRRPRGDDRPVVER